MSDFLLNSELSTNNCYLFNIFTNIVLLKIDDNQNTEIQLMIDLVLKKPLKRERSQTSLFVTSLN